MTRAERAQMYEAYLREEGYSPKVDEDGDIVFKIEGRVYLIMIPEDDEEFFRIIFPNFWSIGSEEERVKVNTACMEATKDTKVAKVFPVRDNTWASIELFCMPPESFRLVFRRCMSALRRAVDTFVQQVK